MSFAYKGFSEFALKAETNWTTLFFSAQLVRNTYAPDPAQRYLSEIASSHRPIAKVQLQGKALVDGAADCSDIVFPKVPNGGFDYIGCIIFDDRATDVASRLWLYLDHGGGWPLTPNGGNVAIVIDAGVNRLFRIGTFPCS